MTIQQQLVEDMKTAMRAHEMEKLTTIRFLLAEIKNAQIDGAGETDADLQKVIASQVKKSKEAAAEFVAAARQDLVAAETEKIAVMEAYLPQQLSDEALEKLVRETLSENTGLNFGQLMGQVMKKVAGRADGKRVQALMVQINGKEQ